MRDPLFCIVFQETQDGYYGFADMDKAKAFAEQKSKENPHGGWYACVPEFGYRNGNNDYDRARDSTPEVNKEENDARRRAILASYQEQSDERTQAAAAFREMFDKAVK